MIDGVALILRVVDEYLGTTLTAMMVAIIMTAMMIADIIIGLIKLFFGF